MKKKLFCSTLSFLVSASVVASSSMSAFANSGTFYSYRLFEYQEQYNEYQDNDLCPMCLTYYIENDDVDNLQRAVIMSGENDTVNLSKVPDGKFALKWYKCKFCKCDPNLTPISLLEYAFSCGSEKCVKYLLENGAKPFNECYDNLVLGAVMSGNAQLIHLAEEAGGQLNIYCLYALLRLSYDINTNDLNGLLKYMLDNNFIDTWVKDEKRLSDVSSCEDEDKAEIALSFLLLAEMESNNPGLFAEGILDEDSPIRRVVDRLISLSKVDGKFSDCFTTLISTVEVSNRPIYTFLKKTFKDYVSTEKPDINALRRSVFLRLKDYLPYSMNDEFHRASLFFNDFN